MLEDSLCWSFKKLENINFISFLYEVMKFLHAIVYTIQTLTTEIGYL